MVYAGGTHTEDIVATHCQWNHTPRLPGNSYLLSIRQQSSTTPHSRQTTIAQDTNDSKQVTWQTPAPSSLPPTIDQPGDASNPSIQRIGPPAARTEWSEPWQIQFYEPAVCDIIEWAKQFSHCNAASVNAFPVHAQFNVKAAEYIEEAINKRQSQGLFVLDGMVTFLRTSLLIYTWTGWWPHHNVDICKLVHE